MKTKKTREGLFKHTDSCNTMLSEYYSGQSSIFCEIKFIHVYLEDMVSILLQSNTPILPVHVRLSGFQFRTHQSYLCVFGWQVFQFQTHQSYLCVFGWVSSSEHTNLTSACPVGRFPVPNTPILPLFVRLAGFQFRTHQSYLCVFGCQVFSSEHTNLTSACSVGMFPVPNTPIYRTRTDPAFAS